MESLMLAIQHKLNPLHVYCRLIEVGVDRKTSMRLSWCYEVLLYKWLTPLTSLLISLGRTTRKS